MVAAQTAKVMATLCAKFLAKTEKALNFVIGMLVLGKHGVMGFGTVRGFGHPLGVLEPTPMDTGGLLYFSKKSNAF